MEDKKRKIIIYKAIFFVCAAVMIISPFFTAQLPNASTGYYVLGAALGVALAMVTMMERTDKEDEKRND